MTTPTPCSTTIRDNGDGTATITITVDDAAAYRARLREHFQHLTDLLERAFNTP